MRITIIALGSQGDVQPYVALGAGLLAAGHQVRLVSHANYLELVTPYGLEFWPARGDVQQVIQSEEMRAIVASGNFIKIAARTAQEATRVASGWAEDGLPACRDADVLLAGVGGLNIALAFAEKLDLPLVQAYVFPFTPTGAFPGVLFPQWVGKMGRAANRLTHRLTRQAMWQGFRAADREARREVLGLPPAPFSGPYGTRRFREGTVLYGFSPLVVPRPADWGRQVEVTGYWLLDPAPGWAPPPGLVNFLESGPPPVYIGFGSMGNRDPAGMTRLVLDGVRESGRRAVLSSGWDGLDTSSLPENVYAVGSVPHTWLFPRMAAVVHHGGAGTTAAGLRAGVPSVIVPFFGDQPFWGRRVAALGLGPEPIARKALTSGKLAGAIRQAVSDSKMRRRAAEFGAGIRLEDGVGRAVYAIGSG